MDTILSIHFEPTKPLELNESDGLWTVNVQSSFGQISLPQDWLKSFFTIVETMYLVSVFNHISLIVLPIKVPLNLTFKSQ